MIIFNYYKLELIASTVSRILGTRPKATPCAYTTTERRYDHDYNMLDQSYNGPYTTPLYYGNTGSIPAGIFEKLFRLICSHSHQGLMLFHKAIQGTYLKYYIYTGIQKIKMFLDLYSRLESFSFLWMQCIWLIKFDFLDWQLSFFSNSDLSECCHHMISTVHQ